MSLLSFISHPLSETTDFDLIKELREQSLVKEMQDYLIRGVEGDRFSLNSTDALELAHRMFTTKCKMFATIKHWMQPDTYIVFTPIEDFTKVSLFKEPWVHQNPESGYNNPTLKETLNNFFFYMLPYPDLIIRASK